MFILSILMQNWGKQSGRTWRAAGAGRLWKYHASDCRNVMKNNFDILTVVWRHGGLVVNALDFRSGGGSSLDRSSCCFLRQETYFTLSLFTQGPVVQRPVNANPGLKVNRGLCFSS